MSHKILVVDDSPTERTLMSLPLQQAGYYIVTAVDGDDALDKIVKENPDLVVLDVVMPKKNGYQVCREIRTRLGKEKLPIILLTTKSEASDKFWGMKQGANEYITKPFKGDELVAIVKRLL
ncbi:response regulator [Candidatus Chlorohelix sp.]|uniref:response regulator transcription factor n=1 Tax=Candidatus Chlorohelix sp. TaxID=3139201 RepID=UPI003057743D